MLSDRIKHGLSFTYIAIAPHLNSKPCSIHDRTHIIYSINYDREKMTTQVPDRALLYNKPQKQSNYIS